MENSTAETTPNKTVEVAATPAPVLKTLNGYNQAIAQQMITNFANNYAADTNRPKSLNAWYNLSELTKIYNLLLDEANHRTTDGVRFYFGCDAPAAGTTKLALSILMVSTELRTPTGSQSEHGDYYDHTADFLNAGTTGAAINDDAVGSLARGASYYAMSAPPNDICSKPGDHYLDTTTVYNWISWRNENNTSGDDSALNTKGEWFPLPFIKAFFGSIINADASIGFDGFRIYLGKGHLDRNGLIRDVLILVPTVAGAAGIHHDYHSCLEGLSTSQVVSTLVPTGKKSSEITARQGHFDRFSKTIKKKSFWHGGGYDEGELCPDNCN